MIRAATKEDLPYVRDLWNAMIRDTTATFTTIEKTLDDLETLWAMRPDGFFVHAPDEVTGFVTWGPFRTGPGYAKTVEHTIIVGNPGQGVGRALMRRAQTVAAAQGHHAMIAGISSENTAACEFHAALGFRIVGRLPEVGRKRDRWLDLIFMHKLLNAP